MFRDFKLERFFARHEFKVEHLLCASDSESFRISDLLALDPGSERKFNNLSLGYTESSGSAELRQEIASLYESISAEEVIVFSGAEEAILAFILTQVKSGDRVSVTCPGYQSLFSLAEDSGAYIDRIELDESKGWTIDEDRIHSVFSSRPTAVIINFPHNPTGAILERDQFNLIAQLANEHDVQVFSDEVYRLGEYQESDRLPAMCDLNEKAISLGVMSKPLGLAGLRIGWVASHNRQLLYKLQAFKDYTTICSSAPSEFLATLALRNRQTLLESNRRIVINNISTMESFVSTWSDFFTLVSPKAGPVCFPQIHWTEGAIGFCDRLIRDAGVLLIPGTYFGHDDKHVRFGLGRSTFTAGIERLSSFLDTL